MVGHGKVVISLVALVISLPFVCSVLLEALDALFDVDCLGFLTTVLRDVAGLDLNVVITSLPLAFVLLTENLPGFRCLFNMSDNDLGELVSVSVFVPDV